VERRGGEGRWREVSGEREEIDRGRRERERSESEKGQELEGECK